MSTYSAHARRDEGWWTVTVPEVDGLFTQAKRLDQIPAMLRDALELFPEIEEAPAEATVTVIVDDSIGDMAREAVELRLKASELATMSSQKMRLTAKYLASQGLPVRDIGSLLDVSFQQAQKLVAQN